MHEIAKLFGKDSPSIVQGQFPTWYNDLKRLLQIDSRTLQKSQDKIL